MPLSDGEFTLEMFHQFAKMATKNAELEKENASLNEQVELISLRPRVQSRLTRLSLLCCVYEG